MPINQNENQERILDESDLEFREAMIKAHNQTNKELEAMGEEPLNPLPWMIEKTNG